MSICPTLERLAAGAFLCSASIGPVAAHTLTIGVRGGPDAMESLGKPSGRMVTPSIFGFGNAPTERRYVGAAAKKLMADAGYSLPAR